MAGISSTSSTSTNAAPRCRKSGSSIARTMAFPIIPNFGVSAINCFVK